MHGAALHCCVHLHVVDTDGGRNGADETHQLLVGVDPHSTMPRRQPTRRPQGPKKEVKEFDHLDALLFSL